jgi:hypothetical protein
MNGEKIAVCQGAAVLSAAEWFDFAHHVGLMQSQKKPDMVSEVEP